MPEENRSRPRTLTVSANMDVEMDVDVDGLGSVQKECLEWLAAILRLCVGVQPLHCCIIPVMRSLQGCDTCVPCYTPLAGMGQSACLR